MKVINSLFKYCRDHSSTVLTAVSIGGLFATTASAIVGTPKAIRILEEREYFLAEEGLPPLSNWGVVKETYKCYIPTFGFLTLTTACMVGANKISMNRYAALASLYAFTDTAYKEYRYKVAETLGDSVHKQIRGDIAKDHIVKKPARDNSVIIIGSGDILCFDDLSGRYFKSSRAHIIDAINNCNRQLMRDMRITINTFYQELGLPDIGIGDSVGWDIDNGFIDVTISSTIDPDGNPALALIYDAEPI